ncbi:hypothetical protein PGTUg99_018941 [Puccinia graminis f. sp. tritici]|uniref:Uncharacterized protein n=2 Tax=Puccinia graminis f. sp. tritici TaxID=56615 RepID=A0A5B0NUJ5_PUCGR|nr:hypothetical protein PGTUg99_018941 [Puccinia graminis f. sp. tritici]
MPGYLHSTSLLFKYVTIVIYLTKLPIQCSAASLSKRSMNTRDEKMIEFLPQAGKSKHVDEGMESHGGKHNSWESFDPMEIEIGINERMSKVPKESTINIGINAPHSRKITLEDTEESIKEMSLEEFVEMAKVVFGLKADEMDSLKNHLRLTFQEKDWTNMQNKEFSHKAIKNTLWWGLRRDIGDEFWGPRDTIDKATENLISHVNKLQNGKIEGALNIKIPPMNGVLDPIQTPKLSHVSREKSIENLEKMSVNEWFILSKDIFGVEDKDKEKFIGYFENIFKKDKLLCGFNGEKPWHQYMIIKGFIWCWQHGYKTQFDNFGKTIDEKVERVITELNNIENGTPEYFDQPLKQTHMALVKMVSDDGKYYEKILHVVQESGIENSGTVNDKLKSGAQHMQYIKQINHKFESTHQKESNNKFLITGSLENKEGSMKDISLERFVQLTPRILGIPDYKVNMLKNHLIENKDVMGEPGEEDWPSNLIITTLEWIWENKLEKSKKYSQRPIQDYPKLVQSVISEFNYIQIEDSVLREIGFIESEESSSFLAYIKWIKNAFELDDKATSTLKRRLGICIPLLNQGSSQLPWLHQLINFTIEKLPSESKIGGKDLRAAWDQDQLIKAFVTKIHALKSAQATERI